MQVPLLSTCSLLDTDLYPGAKDIDVNGAHQPSILHRRGRLETSCQLPHTTHLLHWLGKFTKEQSPCSPKNRMSIARTKVYIRVLSLHQSLHCDYKPPAQATASATRAPLRRPRRYTSFADREDRGVCAQVALHVAGAGDVGLLSVVCRYVGSGHDTGFECHQRRRR